jgi:hypothetical protein
VEQKPNVLKEKHRALLAFIPISISAFLRLYPSILNQAPWGTDGWPLIRISNQLLLHTPAAITGSPIFGYYDIYWPAASLFGSVSSLILNLPPIIIMPIIIPLASSFTALFLFVIVENITNSAKIACVASLLFTTASFDSIFTASVTKETFAEPVFMVGILLAYLLLFQNRSKREWKGIAIFAIIVVALAMSHHATALIFALIILSLAFGRALIGFGGHLFGYGTFFQGSVASIVALPALSCGIVGGYLFIYALAAIPFQVTLQQVTFLSSFLILSLAVAIYFSLERKLRKSNFLIPALIFVVGVLLFALSEFTRIFPLAPLIPGALAFDALPYLIAGGIVIAGYAIAQRMLYRPSFSFLAIWIAVPIALFGYATFAAPDQAVNLYRLFTFLYAPVSVLAGIAFLPLVNPNGEKKNSRTAIKIACAIAIIFAVALLGSLQSYSAVVQNQNLLGGQWAYRPTDISAAMWTNQSSPSNVSIAGDTKISYLFSDYFGMSVNTVLGYNDLTSDLGKMITTPLVTYATMRENGYNLFLYGEPLPDGWQNFLINRSSLVYDNGNDQIWD